ncbi:MAG: TIGR03960 family B12-binding radical SAM protein [Selenomonadales bacterium]|nr:TIGR03960 family B12-binding radical SAM protein [Selenomonadales bacterium]
MDWVLKKELKELLASEEGYYRYPQGTRTAFALAYPNSYFVGMSNLGLHIIYEILNKRHDTACERFFLPERQQIKRYDNTHTPLMSIENQLPLYEFSLIGFVMSFEMDYFNIIEMLKLGKVKLLAAERDERDPLVIAGGPCATFNPEPMAAVIDAFIIGEGEVIMPAFMEAYHQAKQNSVSRKEMLRRLAEVPGVYVPSLYEHQYDDNGILQAITPKAGAPLKVARQWVKDLDKYPAHTVVITDNTEFNFYLIETARGCGRHCRFCMAGYCFRKPRNRSLRVINEEVKKALPYRKRVGLMGAAISDYPEINELCQDILGEGLSMSVASFRADSVTKELVDALAASGLKTLTMAPEAGSSRMRAVINKGIEEQHLFNAIDLGIAAGIRNFRLYIMVGLPFEEKGDVEAIADLAGRLKDYMEAKGAKGTLTLSVNPFIPKPFTPFQWEPMADKKYVEWALKYLAQSLRKRKNVIVNVESPKEAYIQGVLARGDRRVGKALLKAANLGGAKAFKRALKEQNLQFANYLYRKRDFSEIFPWDTLDMGFHREYIYSELVKANEQKKTIQCFEGCHRCGVC